MASSNEPRDLNLAFDEATLLGAEVDPIRRLAALTFSVLSLPETGPAPEDSRVQVLLHDVTRVAASLRLGNWDNQAAPVVPFRLSELLSVVQSFGGCAVYGNDFFDNAEDELAKWHGRFSFDEVLTPETAPHSISLFQEGGGDRHLDFCIWFRELELGDPDGTSIDARQVIEAAERWWRAFREHDPRTLTRGLIPLK